VQGLQAWELKKERNRQHYCPPRQSDEDAGLGRKAADWEGGSSERVNASGRMEWKPRGVTARNRAEKAAAGGVNRRQGREQAGVSVEGKGVSEWKEKAWVRRVEARRE